MCYQIIAILPDSAKIEALAEIAEKYGRTLKTLRNPSIQRQLKPRDLLYSTLMGHCDCGTALGWTQRNMSSAEIAVRRLRRKGWSRAKISRWMEQTANSREIPLRDLSLWQNMLEDMINSRETSYVGLLLHFTRGLLEEDLIELNGREVCKVSKETLELMKDDVLYEFRHEPNHHSSED